MAVAKARELAQAGEHRSAVELLQELVEANPNDAEALFLLAYENDLLGEDDEAIQLYERCVASDTVHVNALINLGVLYEDKADYDNAIKYFERVLAAFPTHARAKLFLKDAKAAKSMYYDEDAEKRFDKFRQVLEIPVTDFELSVRSRNCLRKLGVTTLGDLTRATEVSLLGSKNFGETSLQEIRDMMTQKALRVGMALEDPGSLPSNLNLSAPATEAVTQEMGESEELFGQSVDALNLSVRSAKCMQRLGIETIGQLTQKTEGQLMESKNFGMTSLNEIRAKLTEAGLKLRNSH